MAGPPRRDAWASLTDDERQRVLDKFGQVPAKAAKAMHIGLETYRIVMSPSGTAKQATIDRIRALLSGTQ